MVRGAADTTSASILSGLPSTSTASMWSPIENRWSNSRRLRANLFIEWGMSG